MKCALSGCNGEPTMVAEAAPGATGPGGLAVDCTNVYWTNSTDGTVMTCAKDGCGNSPTVLASGQLEPHRVAVRCASRYTGPRTPTGP